jgi:hypothetical protein
MKTRAFLCLCLLFLAEAATTVAGATITDLFGRDAATAGLTVPDWEGYMANPAIRFTITPPTTLNLPAHIILSTAEPRLYFDMPSQTTAQGSRRELTFNDRKPQSVSIAVFPAREKKDEESRLGIQLLDGRGQRGQLSVPIHIVAVESHDDSKTFPITVDFSQDKTGFYTDASHRAILQQAVADWAFYLQDVQVKPVAAGKEKTWIFEPDGFTKSDLVTNAAGYTGYLLYAYGIDGPELRSGGEPSQAGGFQVGADGKELPMRRSGGTETQTTGNYNTLGWMDPLVADQQWWADTNLQAGPNDLYSIVHHEVGHSLFFNPANRNFHRLAVLKDPAIHAYLGSDIKTDLVDHFDGFVDPASLHGAFGNEYHGKTPFGRWMITKLDLLCAQAIGYKLRPVAPLLSLSISTDHLPDGVQGKPYRQNVVAQGGMPVYDWQVQTGVLPPGLTLNRFTGSINGAAALAGTFAFTINVRDYDAASTGVSQKYQFTVTAP